MAVVSVRTKANSWSGGASAERNGLLYEVIRRRYRSTKLVRVDSMADGPETILATPGVPQIGDSYNLFNDTDTLATCVDVSAPRQTANPLLWEIDVEYDTDRVVSMITDNPLNQPAEVSWDFTKYERPLIRARDNGKAPRNSSGEMYDPPLMWEDARPVCTITRNEASYSPANAFAYHNALNRETWAGAPPLYAKMNFISGKQQFAYGLFYYQVQYQIELNRDSFALKVLDQGFRDINRQLFRDPVTAQGMSSPTLLNGRGKRLTDGVGRIADIAGINNTATTLNINGSELANFPPGAEPLNAFSYRPSGDDEFYIRVDDEIMRVTNSKPLTTAFTVVRGENGTTAAAHTFQAIVQLEPYFLRFIPHDVVSFAPLSLPTV